MKKILIFIGCLYLVSCGDYHVSNFLFQSYCDDKDFVGQFVYQREGLTDEFFREIPEARKDRVGILGEFYLDNKKYLIDANKFANHYWYQFSKRSLVSTIGPIYVDETLITRKSDGKLIGKAISFVNKKGWLHGVNLSMHNTGDKCPIYTSKNGLRLTNSDHFTLIQNTFFKIN